MATWNPKFKTIYVYQIYYCFHTEILSMSMKVFFYKMLILGKMGLIYHSKMGNKLATIAVQHPIRMKKPRTKLKINWQLVGKLPMEN